ncbi:hypothetical protein [Telmatospirillum siberiense]|uniref:hypothetical protein n=1 Tax=Telmatospirillum siberiense TaxID=382514 RepID=UPI001304132A|nr:hypothetical protein [Telmatospirillum siberiense]
MAQTIGTTEQGGRFFHAPNWAEIPEMMTKGIDLMCLVPLPRSETVIFQHREYKLRNFLLKNPQSAYWKIWAKELIARGILSIEAGQWKWIMIKGRLLGGEKLVSTWRI